MTRHRQRRRIFYLFLTVFGLATAAMGQELSGPAATKVPTTAPALCTMPMLVRVAVLVVVLMTVIVAVHSLSFQVWKSA
jgi:hypothetical protein